MNELKLIKGERYTDDNSDMVASGIFQESSGNYIVMTCIEHKSFKTLKGAEKFWSKFE